MSMSHVWSGLVFLNSFNSGAGTWIQCHSVSSLTLELEEESSSPYGQSTLKGTPISLNTWTPRQTITNAIPETRQLSVLASENAHFIPQYDRPRELRVWNGILANILK